MAILLVVVTMVGFGSAAGLAATQQVAQRVVGDSQERSPRVTGPPSAAPALVVAPTVVPPSVAPNILQRGASESSEPSVGAGQPGPAQPQGPPQPQGLACGFSVNGKTGDGSIADPDRCPDPPGRDRAPAAEERGKGVGAGGKGKSDPPAVKATNKGRGNEAPASKASKGKTPDTAKKADMGRAERPPAKGKADKGKADRPAANGNAADQGREDASSSRGASVSERERP
jgi:hypothetical protein